MMSSIGVPKLKVDFMNEPSSMEGSSQPQLTRLTRKQYPVFSHPVSRMGVRANFTRVDKPKPKPIHLFPYQTPIPTHFSNDHYWDWRGLCFEKSFLGRKMLRLLRTTGRS
jgi:hypothetical protein